MEVLTFLVCAGLLIVLAPYILGALVLAATILGGAIIFLVIFIKEVWTDWRR